MTISEITSNLASISVIIASWAAKLGINSWRREAKWKRKYELAEEVLSLFYEARDKIRFIRNPISFGEEGKSRKSSENETPEEKEAFDRAFITIERYHKCSETFNRLNSLKYRFIALFGEKTVKPFQELNNIIDEIIIAAQMLGLYWAKVNKGSNNIERLIEKIDQYEKIIWGGFEDDPIEPKIDEIIKEIENICSPILKEKKPNFLTLNILG